MSTQTQPRVLAGVPTAGEFATAVHAPNSVVLTAFAPDAKVAEFAAIGFDLADSTAQFSAIATDVTRPVTARRVAARAAIERADDHVLHARHALSDDGTGVAALAVEAADDDVVLDAALSIYAHQELEAGDEHLFGVDLAAMVFESDRDCGADRFGRRYGSADRARSEDPWDAYDPGDPKGFALDDAFERADVARS